MLNGYDVPLAHQCRAANKCIKDVRIFSKKNYNKKLHKVFIVKSYDKL